MSQGDLCNNNCKNILKSKSHNEEITFNHQLPKEEFHGTHLINLGSMYG